MKRQITEYKHKKTGAIAGKISENFYNTREFAVIHAQLIEDSLDWEIVEEKSYEILSFKNDLKETFILQKEGFYATDYERYADVSWRTVDHLLTKATKCSIHSVRRISDNFVFTLDDSAKSVNGRGTHKITAFEISQKQINREERDGIDRIWVSWEKDSGGNWLDAIEKVERKPILITEDNVELFEGDDYYTVKIYNEWKIQKWAVYCDTTKVSPSSILRFSSREKAEEYIENSKPQYSLNDIEKAVNIYFTITGEQIFENIKSHLRND